MKVRKLAVALALAGGLGSGVAQALGLGEIELQSYLNEPMDAEIVLPQSRGTDPADVFVNIAPEKAYQRLGLERGPFLGKLSFNVVTLADGSLAVNVSSKEPLKEPYLNFLLELTWPQGRLMREYAVLVDPPVYAEDSGVSEQVRTPSSAQATQSGRSASRNDSGSAVREQSRNNNYRPDTFGPTGPSDTLWTIAASVRQDGSVSTQQVMLALQDLNPDAFIDDNINKLKRGQVLRVPSLDQIRSRSRAEATRVVAQQNEALEAQKRTVDATPEQTEPKSPVADSAIDSDELKLLVADDETGRSESEDGSAGGDSEQSGGVDAGKAVAMEELESARRENDELNSRVDDLQDQVQTLQRLLELKNGQLAELQQGVASEESGQEGVADNGSGQMAEDAFEDGAPSDEAEAIDGDEVESEEGSIPDDAFGAAPDDAEEDTSADAIAAAEQDGTALDGTEDAANESDFVTAKNEDGQGREKKPAEPGQAGGDADGEQKPDNEGVDSQVTGSGVASAAGEPVEEPAKPEARDTSEPQPVTQKSFPGNVIEAITGNVVYQVALGVGLLALLLILLLLARRNANREKAFYEELNNDPEEANNSFDLNLGAKESEQSDAIAEADAYIAYGRYDQAVQALEAATSKEPSRTDLRLKLLGIYADNKDHDSFEKQFDEIQSLDNDEASTEASQLRSRLVEADSGPSIDDLETQLRSGSPDEGKAEGDISESADESDANQVSSTAETAGPDQPGADDPAEGSQSDEDKESRDELIEYDLSGLDFSQPDGESDVSPASPNANEQTDFSSLEIDLDKSAEPSSDGSESYVGIDSGPEADEQASDLDSLDESFLDELDAELDKVAGEEGEPDESNAEEPPLDDLELDVTDEDLALMEEFSSASESEDWEGSVSAGKEDEVPSLDEELDLGAALGKGDSTEGRGALTPEQEAATLEELEDVGSVQALNEEPDSALTEEDLPVASDQVPEESDRLSLADIDETDLGDDDDFDFLAGTDEAATKLDLARAYIEMGDSDGARDILEEVSLEGDSSQKTEAQDLLNNLS